MQIKKVEDDGKIDIKGVQNSVEGGTIVDKKEKMVDGICKMVKLDKKVEQRIN